MSVHSSHLRPDFLLDAEVREPRRYRVILHNDNYTSMEFVIDVLITIFKKQPDEAKAIMLSVHERGVGLCGVYTEEVAETKVTQVRQRARKQGYPLRCSMEEE